MNRSTERREKLMNKLSCIFGSNSIEPDEPYFFEFRDAVYSDYLTEELMEKIVADLNDNGYGDDMETHADSFCNEHAFETFDYFWNKYEQEIIEYWLKSERFLRKGYSPFDLKYAKDEFSEYIISRETSAETYVAERCCKCGATLYAIPLDLNEIINELKFISKSDCLDQDEISWIWLVLEGQRCEDNSKELRTVLSIIKKIVKKFKLKPKEQSNEA